METLTFPEVVLGIFVVLCCFGVAALTAIWTMILPVIGLLWCCGFLT